MQGDHIFEVPNGHKLKITSGNSGLHAFFFFINNLFYMLNSIFQHRVKVPSAKIENVSKLSSLTHTHA